MAAATALTLGPPGTQATLADTATADYFWFTGIAGHRMLITATAPGSENYDLAVADTVITLLLADGTTEWAQNDDAWPSVGTSSALITQLPTSGTYYAKIEDCNAFEASHPGVVGCASAAGVTTFDYGIAAYDLTAGGFESAGSATATATLPYTLSTTTGVFDADYLAGSFATATEHHVFSFTPPANTTTNPSARTRAYFWVQSSGVIDGDGTAANVVLVAKDSQGHVLATSDQAHYTNPVDPANGGMQFSFPLDDQFGNHLGSTYTLDVSLSPTSTVVASKAFYVITHQVIPYYYGQPEEEGPTGAGTNDTVAQAQALTIVGNTSAYADGNLSTAADVDWYNGDGAAGGHADDLVVRLGP